VKSMASFGGKTCLSRAFRSHSKKASWANTVSGVQQKEASKERSSFEADKSLAYPVFPSAWYLDFGVANV
jgi:hypothetical protein